jgi:hypothetical protein
MFYRSLISTSENMEDAEEYLHPYKDLSTRQTTQHHNSRVSARAHTHTRTRTHKQTYAHTHLMFDVSIVSTQNGHPMRENSVILRYITDPTHGGSLEEDITDPNHGGSLEKDFPALPGTVQTLSLMSYSINVQHICIEGVTLHHLCSVM